MSASGALEVMSLLASPTGHLSNLSAPGIAVNAATPGTSTTLRGTVQVHDLRVVADGKSSPFRTRDLHYDISLAGNDFADAGGRLAGSLFGPGHEEMAATVHDARSGVQLLAVVVTGRGRISP